MSKFWPFDSDLRKLLLREDLFAYPGFSLLVFSYQALQFNVDSAPHTQGGWRTLCSRRLGSWKVWQSRSCSGPALQARRNTEKGLYGHEAPCNNV